MLLSGDNYEMAGQMKDVLEGYTQFHHFNRRELNLIEALRTLRMLHHAAWLAKRWQDPAFPIAFPWFGEPRYWEDLILGLREQLGRMQEEPIQIPFLRYKPAIEMLLIMRWGFILWCRTGGGVTDFFQAFGQAAELVL